MNLTDDTLRNLILEELIGVIKVEDFYGKIQEIEITDEPSQEFKTKKAIKVFNGFYRSLEPDTRFYFSEWLRSQLVKRLTTDEVVRLTSRVASSIKGNSEPKQPNQK
jgi:hypothetical protein|tara:strand:- start:245 stop:565 length:321 start_codon:yes stop_codon:yes gene_type:complete